MTHAYSIDTRSQQLVLYLMKLIADSVATDDDNNDEYSSQDVNAASQHQNSPNDVTVKDADVSDHVFCSQHQPFNEYDNSFSAAITSDGQIKSSPSVSGDTTVRDLKKPATLPTPNLSRANINTQKANLDVPSVVARVMEKLTRNNSCTPPSAHKTTPRFVPQQSGYPPTHTVEFIYFYSVIAPVILIVYIGL
ncbi:uncharacterized protein LOC120649502 [Panicum virgatum]|uniref:uncharacterized protein LOC120649502 n=1 Tax=Panicum virgatum TaxID=38727 RepID=UPI0019D557F0|nr:uncharacterized protein LOC120649502 [Panicum virgatum]